MSQSTPNTVDRDALFAAASLVLSAGAEIRVPALYGEMAYFGHNIGPDDLDDFFLWTTNKDEFNAKMEGVTVEKLKLWDVFQDSRYRCAALTKAGVQCKNQLCQGEFPEDARNFIFGKHDRCRIHRTLND